MLKYQNCFSIKKILTKEVSAHLVWTLQGFLLYHRSTLFHLLQNLGVSIYDTCYLSKTHDGSILYLIKACIIAQKKKCGDCFKRKKTVIQFRDQYVFGITVKILSWGIFHLHKHQFWCFLWLSLFCRIFFPFLDIASGLSFFFCSADFTFFLVRFFF